MNTIILACSSTGCSGSGGIGIITLLSICGIIWYFFGDSIKDLFDKLK